MSNSFDPDQARYFVGPNLGPNCLQSLSEQPKLIGVKFCPLVKPKAYSLHPYQAKKVKFIPFKIVYLFKENNLLQPQKIHLLHIFANII